MRENFGRQNRRKSDLMLKILSAELSCQLKFNNSKKSHKIQTPIHFLKRVLMSTFLRIRTFTGNNPTIQCSFKIRKIYSIKIKYFSEISITHFNCSLKINLILADLWELYWMAGSIQSAPNLVAHHWVHMRSSIVTQ